MDRLLRRLLWEHEKIPRDLQECGLVLLTLVCEDLPFAVLSSILVFHSDVSDKLVLLSLLISMLMVGVKIFSIPKCVHLLKRQTELNLVLGRLNPLATDGADKPGALVNALVERSVSELIGDPDFSASLSYAIQGTGAGKVEVTSDGGILWV